VQLSLGAIKAAAEDERTTYTKQISTLQTDAHALRGQASKTLSMLSEILQQLAENSLRALELKSAILAERPVPPFTPSRCHHHPAPQAQDSDVDADRYKIEAAQTEERLVRKMQELVEIKAEVTLHRSSKAAVSKQLLFPKTLFLLLRFAPLHMPLRMPSHMAACVRDEEHESQPQSTTLILMLTFTLTGGVGAGCHQDAVRVVSRGVEQQGPIDLTAADGDGRVQGWDGGSERTCGRAATTACACRNSFVGWQASVLQVLEDGVELEKLFVHTLTHINALHSSAMFLSLKLGLSVCLSVSLSDVRLSNTLSLRTLSCLDCTGLAIGRAERVAEAVRQASRST
jgi:hypothetical protein